MMNARIALRLTPNQEKAIEMLASGCTVRYTALALGLKASTVSGWMKRDKHFKKRLDLRRKELVTPARDERAS
jgi:hypothetical protein